MGFVGALGDWGASQPSNKLLADSVSPLKWASGLCVSRPSADFGY